MKLERSFDVIIVHQEDWFNITGIAALQNSDLEPVLITTNHGHMMQGRLIGRIELFVPSGVRPDPTQVVEILFIQTRLSKILLRLQQLKRALVTSASS